MRWNKLIFFYAELRGINKVRRGLNSITKVGPIIKNENIKH